MKPVLQPGHPLWRQVMQCAFNPAERLVLALTGGVKIGDVGASSEALMSAVVNNWEEGLESLNSLAAKEHVKLRGYEALNYAAENGNTAVVRRLLRLKRVHLSTYDLTVALRHAAAHNHTEAMAALEERGAEYDGECLYVAMCQGHEGATRLAVKGVSSRIDGPLVLRGVVAELRMKAVKKLGKEVHQIVDEQIAAFRAIGR